MAILDGKEILLVGLKGDKGDKGDMGDASNLNIENGAGENSVQQKDTAEAIGSRSVALNHKTKAYQRASMAIGGGTQAGMTEEEFAIYGDIIGGATEYDKAYSFAFASGEGTKSIGRGGFTTGHFSENYGIYGFVGGVSCKNYAKHGFSFGDQIVLEENAQGSAGFGYKTEITNVYAFAANYLNKVDGVYAAAFNFQNTVKGNSSFAVNYNNTIYAYNAFVANVSNIANSGAYASALFGIGNESNYQGQFIAGTYNDNKADTCFEVGNGESNKKRSNAFEVLKDGRAKVYGEPSEAMDVVRWQEYQELLNKIASLEERIAKLEAK